MADQTNAPVQPLEPGMPGPEIKRDAGFMASTTGKVVVGVVALFVLLGIAGVIVFVFAFGGVVGLIKSGGAASTTAAQSVVSSTAVSADAVPVVEPARKPLTASFTFRNVFAPSVKPSTVETDSSTSAPDTLYLTDIVTVGADRQGVFVWNGVTYTAGKDAAIGDSPWQVVEVGTDSVLMLYGDTQVTLTLGQGYSK